MKQEGFQIADIFGACDANMNHFMTVDENGNDGNPTGKLRQAGNDALECADCSASDAFCHTVGRINIVRDALNDCGWHPKSDVEWVMDWALVDETSGVSAEDTALSGFGRTIGVGQMIGSSRIGFREVSPV